MNIGMWIIVIIGGAAGLFSSLYLIVSLPVVIIWKIFRKAKYGITLFN